jgi:hypothetical protein
LREYINNLDDDNKKLIDDIFIIKKMTEALLNSDNTVEVKKFLFRELEIT